MCSPHGHRRTPDRTRRRRRRRLRRSALAGRSPTAIGRPCERPRGAAPLGRDRGGARGRARRLRHSRRERDQGALDRGSPRERERVHRAGDGRLGEYVEPLQKSLDKVEIERQPARAAAAAGVRRDPQGARDRPPEQRGPAHADGKPRQRPARELADARPLGRDPAAAGDRDGRDAVVLRLRRAAVDRRRRRAGAAPRRDREAPGRQVDRDRLEGLARRLPARARGGRRRRSARRRHGRPRSSGARRTSRRSVRRRTGGSSRRRPSSS